MMTTHHEPTWTLIFLSESRNHKQSLFDSIFDFHFFHNRMTYTTRNTINTNNPHFKHVFSPPLHFFLVDINITGQQLIIADCDDFIKKSKFMPV